MPKFIKQISRKSGLSPGALVHVGEHKQAKVRITVIDYSKEHYEQREVETIEDVFAYRDKHSVTWVNVDGLHDVDLIRSVSQYFGVHDLIMADIVNTGHRPKLEDHGEYLFYIFKMLYFEGNAHEVTSEQVSILQGRNFVISFQEKVGDVFDAVRERIKTGKGRARKMGADYLAYILMDAIVDQYFVVLENIGEKIEHLEEELMAGFRPGMTKNIHYLKRDMIFLKKQVWPLREVVNALQRGESKLISKGMAIFLRDVYDHTIQIIDTIESYRDVASGLHDIYLSSMSNRMNEIMKVLTIFAAIFIPLTFIAGIYGMNFDHMPELHWPYGYFMALGLMGILGLVMVIFFKQKKWF